MISSNIESVCVFGSSARMTTDCLSDRDILVVAGEKQRRDDIIQYWCKRGWSVAAYSPRRFVKMIETGSLFIQHLRKEGIILEDSNGWLSRNIKYAKPKHSYAIDAQRSVFLALPMERLDGDALIADELVAADLAYIAARNFGVCYLADRDILTFDYSQIIKRLARDFNLGPEEISLLESLRSGKVAYRRDQKCSNVSGTVGELRDLLGKFFVERPLGNVDLNSPIRDLCTGYATLRDFEVWSLPKVRRNGIKVEELGRNFQVVGKWIHSPRNYSWNIRNISAERLERIRLAIVQIGHTSRTWAHYPKPVSNRLRLRYPKRKHLKTAHAETEFIHAQATLERCAAMQYR